MDVGNPVIYLIVIINGLLVGMVAFFLKQLLTKFGNLEMALNDLKIELARIITKQDHHKDKFQSMETNIARLDVESKDVRTTVHKIGNQVNGVVLRHELLEEKFANCNQRHS